MNKKKVIFIQPALPKYRVPFFENLTSVYDISVFTAYKDFLGVKSIPGIKYVTYNSGFKSLFNKLYWHKGLSLFNFSKGDIIIINGNPRIINYMLLMFLLRIRGIKTVWWGHGWSAGSFGFAARFRIKLMKLATAVLVYTDKEMEKLPISNCYALNNGLDSYEIKKCIKKVAIAREAKPPVFYLVFVGRITEKANFNLLLRSMSAANKNVHLNIIGTGDNIKFYKSMCDDLNIANRVHWHGAIFDEMKVARIMLSSHAFIYPGSVGLSLIHAFNYGLPAIIHYNGKYHMPEFSAFENNVNGIAFEQNSIIDLSAKINELSSLDMAEYKAMSNNAFKTIVDSYNVYDMVSRFTNMIEEIKK